MFGVNAWDSYGTRLSFRSDNEEEITKEEVPEITCADKNQKEGSKPGDCGECLEGYVADYEQQKCVPIESDENGDSDDSQEDAEQPEEVSSQVAPTQSNNYLGYAILGGIGVMAFGYLYFMIRNPKAYVQATAIRTGGNLLGQALTS
mgnify:FL=1|tara:strand:- start:47 stop:487 length:441 start_codon:yes stop_codon:yes gene_type:complete